MNSQYNAAADLAIAQTVYIGGSQSLQDPSGIVDSVWFDGGTNTVHARVTGTLSSLWARVFAPDFDYASRPISELQVVPLTQVNDSTWSGQYLGAWVIGDYLFKVDGTDESDKLVMGGAVTYTSTQNGVLGRAPQVPAALYLGALTACGSGAGMHIAFGLPEACWVTMTVYNMHGCLVSKPVDSYCPAGYHCGWWSNRSGASGCYHVRLRAGARVLSRTVTLAR